MTLRGTLLAAAACLVAAVSAHAQASLRIALLPFDAQGGTATEDAAAVTEIIRAALSASDQFVVIETDSVAAILEESGLGAEASGDLGAAQSVAMRLKADYAITGAVGTDEDSILFSVRLVDTSSARVLLSHRASTTRELVHREIWLFAEGISNEMVAMTVGATLENVQRLAKLGYLDDAARKLDAFNARNPEAPGYKKVYEELQAALADRAFRAAQSLARQAEKDESNRDQYMDNAREYGNEALFLVPDSMEWAGRRERYLAFMRDEIMVYYAAQDKERRDRLIGRAGELVKAGKPEEALAEINDYLGYVGEKAIDESLKKAMDRSRAAIASSFFAKADAAIREKDYRQAERYLGEALRNAGSLRTYAAKRSAIERASQRDEMRNAQKTRYGSSAWDPAARAPLTAQGGLTLFMIDTPTRAWPLGGIVPMPSLTFSASERVVGTMLFDLGLELRAGELAWQGPLDVGSAAVSYWRAEACALAGATLALRGLDLGVDLAALAGAAGYSGITEAYGIEEASGTPLGVEIGGFMRGRLMLRPVKAFTIGLQMDRGLRWAIGRGTSPFTALGVLAGVSF